MIHSYKKTSSIKDFKKTEAQLGILERKAPIEAAAIPFPSEETTPPVMKMYLVLAII